MCFVNMVTPLPTPYRKKREKGKIMHARSPRSDCNDSIVEATIQILHSTCSDLSFTFFLLTGHLRRGGAETFIRRRAKSGRRQRARPGPSSIEGNDCEHIHTHTHTSAMTLTYSAAVPPAAKRKVTSFFLSSFVIVTSITRVCVTHLSGKPRNIRHHVPNTVVLAM